MKDLIQCTAARDDFQRWLALGKAPLTVYKDEDAVVMLVRLDKSEFADYLYQIKLEKDNTISWNNSLIFCGVYTIENQTLYLTEDVLGPLTDGEVPLITQTCPSMINEICGRINQRVEGIIANDRNNLPVRELTGHQELQEFQYYQEHGAKEDASRRLFEDSEPDVQFHSGYKANKLTETTFLAYLEDPECLIQTEAEQYIRSNQERFLLNFLKNDILLAEYQALIQDTDNPIHRMKAITEAVRSCGGKTVRVTVQKDGEELTFRTDVDSLEGYRKEYPTYGIPASDIGGFERLFGRFARYTAMDITKITYGRDVIYKAPPVQSENMGLTMQMGGMV